MSVALGLAFALLAAGAFGAYLYQTTRTATDHVKHARLMPPEQKSDPAGVDGGNGLSDAPLNLLLMGSDATRSSVGRSDTVMLLHLDADRHAAYLISFPGTSTCRSRATARTRSTPHTRSAARS